MSDAGIHFLTMPKWGLAMTKGTVVGWLIEEDAEVRPGLELVEIETEKIVSPIEAATSGVLRRKVARAPTCPSSPMLQWLCCSAGRPSPPSKKSTSTACGRGPLIGIQALPGAR